MCTEEGESGLSDSTVAFLCSVFSRGIRRNWFPTLIDGTHFECKQGFLDGGNSSVPESEELFGEEQLLECLQQLYDPAVVFLLENAQHFESVYNSCSNQYVRDRVAKLIFTQVLLVHRAEMYRQKQQQQQRDG